MSSLVLSTSGTETPRLLDCPVCLLFVYLYMLQSRFPPYSPYFFSPLLTLFRPIHTIRHCLTVNSSFDFYNSSFGRRPFSIKVLLLTFVFKTLPLHRPNTTHQSPRPRLLGSTLLLSLSPVLFWVNSRNLRSWCLHLYITFIIRDTYYLRREVSRQEVLNSQN